MGNKRIILWTMKNGNKIDIDDMTIQHLRNVLKMIVIKNKSIQKKYPKWYNEEDSFNYLENNDLKCT